MAEELPYPLGAVVFREPVGFLGGAGVDAVENGGPQGFAVFIHRQTICAQCAGSHTGDLTGRDPAAPEQGAAELAEIGPPHPQGVMLKISGSRVVHAMRDGFVRDQVEILIQQDAPGAERTDVDSQIVSLLHDDPPAQSPARIWPTVSMKLRTFSVTTRPSGPLKAVPMHTASQSFNFSWTLR